MRLKKEGGGGGCRQKLPSILWFGVSWSSIVLTTSLINFIDFQLHVVADKALTNYTDSGFYLWMILGQVWSSDTFYSLKFEQLINDCFHWCISLHDYQVLSSACHCFQGCSNYDAQTIWVRLLVDLRCVM